MPLLDHFHPPLAPRRKWESFHATWASAIADALNEGLLPERYFAEVQTHLGPRVEIDVATMRDEPRGAGPATLPRTWTAPAATHTIPAAFVGGFEVHVFSDEGGARLVAAIELISPANKDRAGHRRAFAIKCASYLVRGVSLIMVDIVTSRQANLHDETLVLLNQSVPFQPPYGLYAVAYRPIIREGEDLVDIWPAPLQLGQALPTLPLALDAETCLPIDLDATYTDACRRSRIEA